LVSLLINISSSRKAKRPSTTLGREPLLTQRYAFYNPVPGPSSKVKTRVMTIMEMAITRLAATAVSQRRRFRLRSGIESSKFHHCLQPRTLS
jgi:hypothetical protein